ncbi:precorrin-3B synthase [Bosea beijingensis]|uniref:precorrin-3B synthase n=1 Tax=Bosea beijingensis TaxID=3068632 RepID=UPI002740A65D|nr:precorrin-3B synthase [Bosea sp. REN20]
MSALPREALRRGWCPSTLRPMETGDGWLVRLHPPGAKLTPAQLRRIAALAAAHGNGLIEISARANLQIRGVTPESHPKLVERLLVEHLVDEHAGDGPQRVTLVSPLAGRDPTSLIDAAALAEQIEQRARVLPGLPAKLCIVVDDGGAQALGGFAGDLRLIGLDGGRVALCLGDRLWHGPIPVIDTTIAVETILRGFAALRAAAPDRIRRLRDLSPEALANLSSLPDANAPTSRMPPRRAGLFALDGDRFAALIGLPFGRCDAAELDRLGATVETSAADIRLSPWRGLAFRDLDRTEAGSLLALADDLGLITGDDDPRLSVQACAGSPACSRAEAPTMADAAKLAEAAADLLAQGATLHVSGCVKACAHPVAADLTLVGRGGLYDVVMGGTTRDNPVATLDLSALLTRLQPGEDIHARLTAARSTGSQG